VGFVAHIKGQKSHGIVEQGLLILKNLDHRGAVGADPLQGDGAGILIQIPDQFYREEMARQGVDLPPAGEYGVGMVFLPAGKALPASPASRKSSARSRPKARCCSAGAMCRSTRHADVADGQGQGAGDPPGVRRPRPGCLRHRCARAQAVRHPPPRRQRHQVAEAQARPGVLRAVLSARTVNYKGLLLADQVGVYYLDLQDKRMVSALALVHQRFSTNTFPTWDLAHPFRMIAHNGEINTVRGNVNWIQGARAGDFSPMLGDDLKKVWPLIYPGQSDSALSTTRSNCWSCGGYSLAARDDADDPGSLGKHPLMDENRRAFYEYHAAMMEPWDGPAAWPSPTAARSAPRSTATACVRRAIWSPMTTSW
jgi:glutamate synthase (NADPH) large chain